MRLRSLGFAALAAGALVQSCQPACTPPAPAPATTTTTTAPRPVHPTSVTIAGQGNGHGRGLSAWGAYGMAIAGSPWQDIVAKYYGGTSPAGVGDRNVRIRLIWAEAKADVTVISKRSAARWNGGGATSYGSLRAVRVGANLYDVYGAAGIGCAEANVGWKLVGDNVRGPIRFTTTINETSGAAGDVLGVCRPDGSIIHYRGALDVLTDSTGAHRLVNELRIENYLKGVLSREVPASWGNTAPGMNSLRAMAVAARSFAHSQGRYEYAQTCETSTCQVYGGAAFRKTAADATTSFPSATQVCLDTKTFECANTNRAISETAGQVRTWPGGGIISGEYSATHGPYSSGINYPWVDDSVSNVPSNPKYTWTVTIPAKDIAAKYGLGTLTGARSEREPGNAARGVWGNRIVLTGTTKNVVLTNLQFRNDFKLPSHGYAVKSVNH